MTTKETVCKAICQSRKFETGEGTCTFLCMGMLGDARRRGCSYIVEVHGALADKILQALDEMPADDAP